MTYKPPTYTQVPNLLLDNHVQKMSKAELKIILATCRKTFGWQKGKDRISYTQFEKLTGLSRASVQEGIKQAMEHGYLRRYQVRNGFEYALAIDSIPEFEPLAIPEIEHTKESILKKHTLSDPVTDMLGKKDPLAGYPVDAVNLLRTYIVVTNTTPITSEKGDWIKTARVWLELGVRPEDVRYMYAYAIDNEWGVARPGSITKAYRMMKTQLTKEQVKLERQRKEVYD